ncbi:MAG: hypothetical protein ACTHJ2_07755 [Candidatus Nitrosocosmicus sp.]
MINSKERKICGSVTSSSRYSYLVFASSWCNKSDRLWQLMDHRLCITMAI